MRRWLLAYWQVVSVSFLFVGSLTALLVNSFAAAFVPQQEMEQRDRVRQAGQKLAEAVQPVASQWPPPLEMPGGRIAEAFHKTLAATTYDVLQSFPGCEGGIYFGGEIDQFSGFSFPNPPAQPPPDRREPPPVELSSIHFQVRESLRHTGRESLLVEARDIGAGRVAVATLTVGNELPARVGVWVMTRLSPADQQKDLLRRYQLSAGFGLIGVLLSLLLTLSLRRNLRRSRRQQDRLKDELRRAEHLAALGKMLAGVAHEVRNPLAAIRSTVQLWQRLPEQARTPESLEAVVRGVDQLNNLVSRLLLFARTGNEEHKPIDLNSLIADTVELHKAQATEQNVFLESNRAPALPDILGAAQALKQVFLNLISNALQAMPRGGELLIETSALSGGVEILVADTGPGIAPADRVHLFDLFFTTRSNGTGLGLALCREIITQHGGHIELVSNVSVGATFRIFLPSAKATFQE